MQAVALRETQLRKLVDDLDSFVHSSALTTAAWLAQIDALIFPQRQAPLCASVLHIPIASICHARSLCLVLYWHPAALRHCCALTQCSSGSVLQPGIGQELSVTWLL